MGCANVKANCFTGWFVHLKNNNNNKTLTEVVTDQSKYQRIHADDSGVMIRDS